MSLPGVFGLLQASRIGIHAVEDEIPRSSRISGRDDALVISTVELCYCRLAWALARVEKSGDSVIR